MEEGRRGVKNKEDVGRKKNYKKNVSNKEGNKSSS
jgi:hypothetical protein